MQLLLAACAAVGLVQDPTISAEEFSRLLGPLHGGIHDVSLICEGASEFIGPIEILKGGNPNRTYQCSFVYRSDESTRIELYLKGSAIDAPFLHSLKTLHQGKIEDLTVNPDSRAIGKAKVTHGTSASLRDTGSPNYILFLWFFRPVIENPAARRYEYQGWEDIDGHKCLRAQFDYIVGYEGKNKPVIRFWIDMARGGHPLRVETYMGGKLMSRVGAIRLDRFALPSGGEVWLPTDGSLEYFAWGPKNFERPVQRETYHVVGGTVRLNRNLKDAVFSVKWKDDTPETGGMSRMRREFESASSATEHAPREPRDPESIRERINKKLIEADLQSEMLQASSAARSAWTWASFVQLVAALVGCSLLGIAALWKWRARG